MAIGPIPQYIHRYPLAGLSPQQFLILAIEAAAGLGWSIRYCSAAGLVAAALPRGAQITVRIAADAASLISGSLVRELSDRGRNRKNIGELIRAIERLRNSLSADQLDARFEALAPVLPPAEADPLLRTLPEQRSAAADFFAIFRPSAGYFVTPLILNGNLLFFLLMGLSGGGWIEPDAASLVAWGANARALTLGGEWWRLLSSCFVHIGAVHLLLNMYAFLLIGAQLEPRLGRLRFGAAYLLSGAGASALSLWWHQGAAISAGASGAIFGMYGVFIIMLRTDMVEKARRRQLLASMAFFVIYNLLGGLQPGIDNAAHLGGLLTGAAISACFIPGLRRAHDRQQALSTPPVPPAREPEDYY